MPFDEVTGKTAQENQITNKESREAIIAEKLMDARHMKQLYGCNFMELRNALAIKKHPHQNYPTPCIENLNRENEVTTTKAPHTKHKHKPKRSKQNRGQKMVQAALLQANKKSI
eukprot:437719_1